MQVMNGLINTTRTLQVVTRDGRRLVSRSPRGALVTAHS